jgi:probable rRNA maturation factor
MSVALSFLRRLPRRNVDHIRAVLVAAKKAAGYPDWDIGCHITSDEGIRRLNKRYRGVDSPTDVLSFSFHELSAPEQWPANMDADEKNLGDMVISADYLAAWCIRHGVPEGERYERLIAHSIAHMLGYDHETDEQHAAMSVREEGILRATRSVLRVSGDTLERRSVTGTFQ